MSDLCATCSGRGRLPRIPDAQRELCSDCTTDADWAMVAHANNRGHIRVVNGEGYETDSILIRWVPKSKHCRIQYRSGAQRTILKSQVRSVVPLEAG